jgi:tripartite-type tricarboxylate transporter receptor subunit TctC
MQRIHALRAFVTTALVALAFGAHAAYPEKPVQYIIPFPAGGESDIAARLQQQVLKAKFDQEMVVVNRAGAGGGLVWAQLNSLPNANAGVRARAHAEVPGDREVDRNGQVRLAHCR